MPAARPELFLTFDDGPIPGITDFVLEVLKNFSARATFFCIGDNVRKHPSVFRKLIDNEQAIGNHTFNHLNGWRCETSVYCENIRECDQVMDDTVNGSSNGKIFRPPYGRISRRQVSKLDEYKIIMWDVLSKDYDKSLSVEKCLKNTIAATRPGSIIVFHDSVKAEKNLTYVLPRYLEHFRELGYVFKSL